MSDLSWMDDDAGNNLPQEDTTINSELRKILSEMIALCDNEGQEYMWQEAEPKLQQVVAQEANKARLNELKELLHFRKGEVIGLATIQDKIIYRIAQLTADKEQA